MGPTVARTLSSPAAVVWKLLVEVEAWPRWGPTVAGATVTVAGATVPSGVIGAGARGTVRTAVGLSLPFSITRFEEGRRWDWSVAGVPATSHRVEPAADGCVVTFGVPWWAPAYLPVCAVALRRLEALASQG